MDIKDIKGIRTSENFDSKALKSVIARAHAGNTLLFLGAGFSLGSQNQDGTPIPLAKDLSKAICKLGEFEEDEDLAYSADYYIKYNDPERLIGLLSRNFTILNTEKYHQNISRVDWRRVYTTNYDNCFELAAGLAGKVISPITIDDNPAQNFRRRDICIHINGAIQLLDESTLDSSFKLTESSYTNADSFRDSSWLYRFRKDIDACSQIIFVGYSLYDMEVKRLLVKNEDIKKKTFFITREGVSTKEHHRLSAFGEVFPIGVEEFGRLIGQYKAPEIPRELGYLEALEKMDISYDADFTDSDIRDFLLRGVVELNYLAASITARDKSYAAPRKQTDEVLECFQSFDAAVIYGGIANGKSTIARQVVAQLLLNGEIVYSIRDNEAKYEKDIESISKINQRVFLVVDDFEQELDAILYFFSQMGGKGKLILTERPHRYRRAIKSVADSGASIFTTSADYLRRGEVEYIAKLITNSGLWGARAGDGYGNQIRYLTNECESQLSTILLQLLKSPYVANLFKDSFEKIETKKTVFSLCLIQHIYPKQCTKSFIADISDSNHVYSIEFEDRIRESEMFEMRGNGFISRSAIFSTYVLSNFYRSSYTIDQLVRIAVKLQQHRSQQSYEEHEMYRSIMTFGTLAAILEEKNRANSYIQYYEKLKQEVPNVIGNPHYWLQYAMAIMSENNLSDAERILETAYAKAENSPNYDTTYIDNQFARLRLKQAIQESEQNQSFQYFTEAHKILSREEDDVFKFRQAGLYIPYYDERYSGLSKGNKVKFEHSVREMLTQYENYLAFEYPNGDVSPFQEERIDEFRRVVQTIANERNA